ncbi:hypothetical protein [Actinophytocola sediminis]
MNTTTTPVQEALLAAYLELSTKPQDWVRLARLRPLVKADRAAFDAALIDLTRTGSIHLAPDSNRKAQTADDHAAALRFSGMDQHLVAVDDDYFV